MERCRPPRLIRLNIDWRSSWGCIRASSGREAAPRPSSGYMGPNTESAQQEAFEIKRQLTRIADTVQQDLDAAGCGRLVLRDAPALGGTVREAPLAQAVIYGLDAEYNTDPNEIALDVEQAIARHDAGTASRSPGIRRRKKPSGESAQCPVFSEGSPPHPWRTSVRDRPRGDRASVVDRLDPAALLIAVPLA